MKNLKKFAVIAASVCALALTADRASAVASLSLFDGTTTINVADGSGGDSNTNNGAVTFNGAIGVWTINVSTGLSKPILGSSSSPQMDLNSVDFSSAAGTLVIRFTDDGFNTPGGGSAYATIGGTLANTAGNSITYKTYQIIGGITNLLTTISANTTPFSGVGSTPTTPSGSYSLVQEITLVHKAKGNTSFDATLTVPDGGMTAALLGFGLLGVEGLRRKFKA